MKDHELELLNDWGFCKIPYGEKGPRYKDWHKKPYKLSQITETENVGVILGPRSNGILAIDFDGPWAWEYWKEHIKIPFDSFDTVMWTSNKPGRCQMAFKVPKEFWDHIPTKFAKSGPVGDDGKPQQLEFRWGTDDVATQSVLPPSLHPDNKKDPDINYVWLRKPSEVKVAEVPMQLLEWAILDREKQNNYVPEPVKQFEPKDVTGEEANKLCAELKSLYPVLDYETWIRVTWAFCNTVGYTDGITIMQYYYPEQKKGEYQKLSRSHTSKKQCTIGTVIKMINDRQPKHKKALKNELFYNGNARDLT